MKSFGTMAQVWVCRLNKSLRVCCLIFVAAVHSHGWTATDLSGWWGTSAVGELELKQVGDVVMARQKDPDIVEALGDKMFEGKLVGNVVKGRIATVLPDHMKAVCGKKWANWVDFELTLSLDGSRLEGKWLQHYRSDLKGECPVESAEWQPWALQRAAAPPSNNYLLGLLCLALLSAVFVVVRMAFVNYLVGSLKRSPNRAGTSGWALFAGLFFVSLVACLALISTNYLTIAIISTLSAVSILCFAICGFTASKK